MTSWVPLPKTSAPALRALAEAGYTDLAQLNNVSMPSLLALHGMGPKAIGALRRALAEHGWSFCDDDPSVGQVAGGLVSLTAGSQPTRNANATAPTQVDPVQWVSQLPKLRQRRDGQSLLTIFAAATGEAPVMWGPSIVGYGAVHYVYESGREGDMAVVGFSPRTSAISLYGLHSHRQAAALLAQLGPHRTGAGCLYIKSLADVDEPTVARLVRTAWQARAR